MGTTISREAALATVQRSPDAVAAHDKDAWLALFAGLSAIEDPVGSRAHVNGTFDARSGRRGDGAGSRFYDTFIAPNTINFDVETDIVCATHVVRDLTIEITMAPGVDIRVPMHLLYELCDEDGQLKIRRLAAHWELLPMIGTLMAKGPRAWPVGMALGRRMLANLGVSGTIGFTGGMRTVGRSGKSSVRRFVDASNAKDTAAVAGILDPGAAIRVAGLDSTMTPAEFASSGPRLSVGKLLASGYTVSASVDVEHAGGESHGVGFFEFDRRSGRIHRVDLYWD